MRKAEFMVPAELMPKFTEELVSTKLDNQLTGVTEDDDIVIEVEYEQEETEAVDELEEFLNDLIEESKEEEEEDPEEED